MIKFFRKIRQKMLIESKFSKYLLYAIGEIVLVVIGILIALQINNSNNKKIETQREFKYLTNIKLDLKKDVENLEYSIDFRQKKSLGIEKIIRQINGQPIQDLNETTYNVINTLNQERFQPSNVTYNDLVNSGNMNLISNDSIKIYLFELSLHYQQNLFNIEHETAEYEENTSKSILKLVDIERMKPVFLGKKTAEQVNISEKDFKTLFESLEYKNGCVVAKWTSEGMIELYQNIKKKSEHVIELINTELKK
ncbi:DUF6090 family protein [Ichthyenterobacterium magnum]|uniref:Uncharacterized protein n=1 Tax=Ichthyenterobacterium magnum TaxID=1230530 RepID=A0A420DGD6_9FLAO|nr:DUF6090 family protein [Ichthyenterobacterium magnum]RKE92146.1 hypothetical protein BXY80_2060 [Ichthyenterobacterium magnum]